MNWLDSRAMAATVEVRASVWTELAGVDLRARVTGLYLQTNEAAAAEPYGVYRLPLPQAAKDLGLEQAAVLLALRQLQAHQWSYYDEPTGWVWVVNHAAEQLLPEGRKPLLPRDNAVRAANKWYDALPSNPWLGPFYEHYRLLLHLRRKRHPDLLGPDVGTLVVGTPSQALVLPEPPQLEKAHIQRQYDFEVLWDAYPKAGKVAKQKARDTWMRLEKPPRMDDVIEGLKRWYRSRRWAEGYIVHCDRWIREQRWTDDPEPCAESGRTVNIVRTLRGDIFGAD